MRAYFASSAELLRSWPILMQVSSSLLYRSRPFPAYNALPLPFVALALLLGVPDSLPEVSSPEVTPPEGVTPPVPFATRFLPLTVLRVFKWCEGIHSEGSEGVLGRGVGDFATTAVCSLRPVVAGFLPLGAGNTLGSTKDL